MQSYPAQSYFDKPPKCLAPGIIVLVIGILEFIAMIACLIIVAALVPDGGATASAAAPGWWEFGLSSALFIVTGSLAIASARGRKNCHIAGIVFSSITLAWSLINLLLFLVALTVVEAGLAAIESDNDIQMNEAARAVVSVTQAILIVSLIILVLLVACDISILVLISKVTCCTRSADSMAIVIQEAPPAMQSAYPHARANAI